MKRHLLVTLIWFAAITSVRAQDFKVNKSSGKMVLNLGSVLVEGYSGNEIVFSSQKAKEEEDDPRAKGLRIINGAGFIDNTGLGISVTETGTTVEVNQVGSDVAIKVLVPKAILVSFVYHKVMNAGNVFFRNMGNEIEISTDYNKVQLENVTGPVSIRTLYGAIDAKFSGPVRGPVSIASVHASVDVAIPTDTKANLKLNSTMGSILASPDLKIDLEKNVENGMVSYSSSVNGKLNGGGAEFKLTSEYGKIYLRTAK